MFDPGKSFIHVQYSWVRMEPTWVEHFTVLLSEHRSASRLTQTMLNYFLITNALAYRRLRKEGFIWYRELRENRSRIIWSFFDELTLSYSAQTAPVIISTTTFWYNKFKNILNLFYYWSRVFTKRMGQSTKKKRVNFALFWWLQICLTTKVCFHYNSLNLANLMICRCNRAFILLEFWH